MSSVACLSVGIIGFARWNAVNKYQRCRICCKLPIGYMRNVKIECYIKGRKCNGHDRRGNCLRWKLKYCESLPPYNSRNHARCLCNHYLRWISLTVVNGSTTVIICMLGLFRALWCCIYVVYVENSKSRILSTYIRVAKGECNNSLSMCR